MLPYELYKYIIELLSSDIRSKLCTVSKLFESICVLVSKELSPMPFLYEKCVHTLTSDNIKQILLRGDYHLIVRLKTRRLINLELACKCGNLSIIELMIKKGAYNWNMGLSGACLGGHLNIVELMIEKGANNWNWGLYCACYGNHLNIVELMIEKGANNWDSGLNRACSGGHLNIVELMIEKGAKSNIDWNFGLCNACYGGHLSIVKLLIEKGANKCNCGKTIKEHKM
jgi:hypothetical protein